MFDAIPSMPAIRPRGFVRFTHPERLVFRRSENLDPADWAEKYRVVASGSHAGPWLHANSPYTVGPMRAYHLPHVREIFLCWGPQAGKTEVLINCFGCATSQDPGLSMIIQPDENKAALFLDRRIKKTIEKTPELAAIYSRKKDYHLLFKNGSEAIGAWAGSATALSSEAACRVFADEFDKYPATAGREISPIEAARARMITYPDTYKLLGTSTPNDEGGNMDTVLKEEVSEIRHYFAVCPKCGAEQRIDHNRFEWPKGATRQEVIRHKLARYLCVECSFPWDDATRNAAVLSGLSRNLDGWKAENPVARPVSIAFQLPGWYSPNVSLSKAAAALMKA
ncbi:MAG: phage terminase large subunit family protein, partial [Pseudomonadota bacterium]